MSQRIEICCNCANPTGNAGRADGSIYVQSYGPLCFACFDDVRKEIRQLDADDAPARSEEGEASAPTPTREAVDVPKIIAELDALDAKRTPGEWTRKKPERDGDGWTKGVGVAGCGPGCMIYANPPGGSYPSNDADFIVALVNSYASLRALALRTPPVAPSEFVRAAVLANIREAESAVTYFDCECDNIGDDEACALCRTIAALDTARKALDAGGA